MKFFLSILALLISTGLAQACLVASHYDIEDVLSADILVVGRVESYKVTEWLNPARSPNLAISADIEVRVDEVLVGSVPEGFRATWSDPYGGLSLPLPNEHFLMGFRHSNSKKRRPWEDTLTADRSSAKLPLSLLHKPCAESFIFSTPSEYTRYIRQLLLQ